MPSTNSFNPEARQDWTQVLLQDPFPAIDIALRSGKHITTESLISFNFINENFDAISNFYSRYQVELVRAAENFFYLRSLPNSLIPKVALPLLETFLGKLLCLLYFQPEKLDRGGWFTLELVLEQLHQLIDPNKLFVLIHPRAFGSQVDQQKLREKVRQGLLHLRRLGFLTMTAASAEAEKGTSEQLRFQITEGIFRFAADVREGQTPAEAQEQLLRLGELSTCATNRSPNEEKDD